MTNKTVVFDQNGVLGRPLYYNEAWWASVGLSDAWCSSAVASARVVHGVVVPGGHGGAGTRSTCGAHRGTGPGAHPPPSPFVF